MDENIKFKTKLEINNTNYEKVFNNKIEIEKDLYKEIDNRNTKYLELKIRYDNIFDENKKYKTELEINNRN